MLAHLGLPTYTARRHRGFNPSASVSGTITYHSGARDEVVKAAPTAVDDGPEKAGPEQRQGHEARQCPHHDDERIQWLARASKQGGAGEHATDGAAAQLHHDDVVRGAEER